MRALPLSQSQGISYEITHGHLSRFIWTHDLHDGTIRPLQCHHHLVQLLPRIQVQVTLHQWYIKIHLEGLNSGLRLLSITTLALGSRPSQGLARLKAKREARWGSHLMLLGMQKSVREWTLTFPSELPFWELESQWTFKFLEGNCRGQNSLDWDVPYIIEKFLKHRCLKWACMTHLDI
jgi:hypothetical protein